MKAIALPTTLLLLAFAVPSAQAACDTGSNALAGHSVGYEACTGDDGNKLTVFVDGQSVKVGANPLVDGRIVQGGAYVNGDGYAVDVAEGSGPRAVEFALVQSTGGSNVNLVQGWAGEYASVSVGTSYVEARPDHGFLVCVEARPGITLVCPPL